MNIRRLAVATSLLAIASTAVAQEQVSVKLTSATVAGSSKVPWNGVYVSPYTGLVTQGSSSQTVIMNCVDYFHHVSVGQTWTAYKTVLFDGADLSKTRFNNAELYLQAAYLSWQVPLIPSSDPFTTIAVQTAIWQILSPTSPDPTGSLLTARDALITEAQDNWQSANTGQFYILTAVNKNDANSAQEFLVYDPNLPVVTPEPGTLTLLGTGIAGVAGWRRRRKQKRSTEAVAA